MLNNWIIDIKQEPFFESVAGENISAFKYKAIVTPAEYSRYVFVNTIPITEMVDGLQLSNDGYNHILDIVVYDRCIDRFKIEINVYAVIGNAEKFIGSIKRAYEPVVLKEYKEGMERSNKMINSNVSFQLLRTNPKLTGNVKVVVTEDSKLYLDTFKGKVAARAYDKFFNINERPETKFDMLQHKLQFPVTAYVKENGYLGIVSYDEYNDDLFIASKSTIDSQFAQWLKEAIYNQITEENREKMKQYAKDNNVSFVFENVDMKNDPHIIEYPESKLYLLDIVYNQMDFAKYDYETMCDIAHQLGLTPKEKAFEIANWQDFYDWYYDILEEDYEYNGRKIEGFVIEDSVGYMTKLKLAYYNFWKFMRAISHEAIRNGYIKKTSALTTPIANEYYAWVRKLHDVDDIDSIPKDICTLRKLFFKDKLGE